MSSLMQVGHCSLASLSHPGVSHELVMARLDYN